MASFLANGGVLSPTSHQLRVRADPTGSGGGGTGIGTVKAPKPVKVRGGRSRRPVPSPNSGSPPAPAAAAAASASDGFAMSANGPSQGAASVPQGAAVPVFPTSVLSPTSLESAFSAVHSPCQPPQALPRGQPAQALKAAPPTLVVVPTPGGGKYLQYALHDPATGKLMLLPPVSLMKPQLLHQAVADAQKMLYPAQPMQQLHQTHHHHHQGVKQSRATIRPAPFETSLTTSVMHVKHAGPPPSPLASPAGNQIVAPAEFCASGSSTGNKKHKSRVGLS